MIAPEWLVWLTLIASVLAAVATSIIVSVKSAANRDSVWREWAKRSTYPVGAMLGVWAIFFIIGNALALFSK